MIITIRFTNNHACYQLVFNRVHQNFAEKNHPCCGYTQFSDTPIFGCLPCLSTHGDPPTRCALKFQYLYLFDWLVLIASPSVAILQLNNSLPPPFFFVTSQSLFILLPLWLGVDTHLACTLAAVLLFDRFNPSENREFVGMQNKNAFEEPNSLIISRLWSSISQSSTPPSTATGREEQIRRACCLAPSPGRSENCKLAHTFGPEKANIMIAIGNGSPTNIHNNDENENADSDDNSWQLKVLRKWDTTRN